MLIFCVFDATKDTFIESKSPPNPLFDDHRLIKWSRDVYFSQDNEEVSCVAWMSSFRSGLVYNLTYRAQTPNCLTSPIKTQSPIVK